MQLFKYCKDSFGNVGVNISFPKDTNPKLTYKWRYLVKFAEKVDSWKIDDDTVMVVIDAIIKHAKANKQLNKGLSLLHSDKVLEMGYEALKKREADIASIAYNIQTTHDIVSACDNLNIVNMFLTRKVSKTYLAISKKCCNAMLAVSQDNRGMLPSGSDLIRVRAMVECNKSLKSNIKN